jgi:hypothetical protein
MQRVMIVNTCRGGRRSGTFDDDLADGEDLALGSLSGTISPFAKTLTMVETMLRNNNICMNKVKYKMQSNVIIMHRSSDLQ